MSLCGCGCGQPTKLAPRTDARKGWIKGRPMRYLWQHHATKSPVPYLVEDRGYETPCWVWQRATHTGGYGTKYLPGKVKVKAHRWYYEQAKGPIPVGLEIDHLCRVRACVNPDHLEPVTRSENHRRSHRDNPRARVNGVFVRKGAA